MPSTTYRVDIAYDGSAFAGFARQPGCVTVESTLLEALATLDAGTSHFSVGGRTDRGVHAVGQVISFRCREPVDESRIVDAIDRARPGHLLAQSARSAPRRFHARHWAQKRHYAYFHADPAQAVDAVRLERMLGALEGLRCFSAFARDTAPGKSTIRRLHEATVRRVRFGDVFAIRFDFVGDGFLRQQVRVMVSTALRALERDDPEDALVRLATNGERGLTAPAADPNGLYLVRIIY